MADSYVVKIGFMSGRLITIEGIDGSGKSTVAASLVHVLQGRGVVTHLLREPGGVLLSERIRSLVQDPALHVGKRAEALLYAAARAQLVEERLEEMLNNGSWVVLDRFIDSSLAYQGGGRGLGKEVIASLNEFATAGLFPDRTILLAVDPKTGRERQAQRGLQPDRLENEADHFFESVNRVYHELAEQEPSRIRVVNGEAKQKDVLRNVVSAIEDLIPET